MDFHVTLDGRSDRLEQVEVDRHVEAAIHVAAANIWLRCLERNL